MRERLRTAPSASSVQRRSPDLAARPRLQFLQPASDGLPSLGEWLQSLQDHRSQDLDVDLSGCALVQLAEQLAFEFKQLLGTTDRFEPQIVVSLLTGSPQNLLRLAVELTQSVEQSIGLANLAGLGRLGELLGQMSVPATVQSGSRLFRYEPKCCVTTRSSTARRRWPDAGVVAEGAGAGHRRLTRS